MAMTPEETELIFETANTIGAVGRRCIRDINTALEIIADNSLLKAPLLHIRMHLDDIPNQLRPLYQLVNEEKEKE